jgi:hypothetical protein
MSMNLHCNEVNLLQTPTFITYMCWSNEDGGWQGVKYRYIQWVKYQCQVDFNQSQAEVDNSDFMKQHIAELNSYKKLTFSII